MVLVPVADLDIFELVIEGLDVGIVSEFRVQSFVGYASEEISSLVVHVARAILE